MKKRKPPVDDEPRIEAPPPFVPRRSTRDPALGRAGIMFCPNPECMKCFVDAGAESTRDERLFVCEDDERGEGCGVQWQGRGRPLAIVTAPTTPAAPPMLTLEERAQCARGRIVCTLPLLGAEELEAVAADLEGRVR